MKFENYLEQYDSNTIVSYLTMQKLLANLRTHIMIEKSKQDFEAKENPSGEVSEEAMQRGIKFQATAEAEIADVKMQLVCLFFKLTPEQIETMDFSIFEKMVERIETDRPAIFVRLKISNKTQTETTAIEQDLSAETISTI